MYHICYIMHGIRLQLSKSCLEVISLVEMPFCMMHKTASICAWYMQWRWSIFFIFLNNFTVFWILDFQKWSVLLPPYGRVMKDIIIRLDSVKLQKKIPSFHILEQKSQKAYSVNGNVTLASLVVSKKCRRNGLQTYVMIMTLHFSTSQGILFLFTFPGFSVLLFISICIYIWLYIVYSIWPFLPYLQVSINYWIGFAFLWGGGDRKICSNFPILTLHPSWIQYKSAVSNIRSNQLR